MLVTTWFEDPHRPTRDLDLLGYGDPSAEAMSIVWKEICETVVDDGITFDSEALRIAPIRLGSIPVYGEDTALECR
jgi:hypothetical protein